MMANNNTLTTNFNTSPYYDDFNENKNYHRILFNPSLAVQARELTQLQTILQNQIDRNAEHFFAEGAIVKNGKTNVDYDTFYIKVNDEDTISNPLNLSELVGKRLTSANNGINALVMSYASGSEAEDPDTKTLFIKYLSGSTDGTEKVFKKNETITSNTGVTFQVFNSNTAVGTGVSLHITDGIIFAKDHFIRFDEQRVILSKYSLTPTCKAGFVIEENIITNNEDFTLLDPASGSYNYAAPGADRLQLVPVLRVYNDGDTIPDDFIQILDIRSGVINKLVTRTEYSVIRDEFARRTYDESGDYVVNGLKIRLREHLNDGTNAGFLSQIDGGNSSLLAVGVEPGKAYVKGYEVEKIVTEYVSIEKGIDAKEVSGQTIAANYGNYVRVNELVGDWNVNDGIVVTLHDTADKKITNRTYSGSASGAQIGTATLKSIEYESGIPGANSAIYRAHLTNVVMSNAAFSSVKALHYDNASTADASADVYGTPELLEKNFDNSIFKIPTENIKRIRDDGGNVETSFSFKKKFDISIGTNGTFTLNTGTANEIFPFGAGALNTTQKRENFQLCFNAATSILMAGTISTSGTTVNGSGTAFTKLNVGDKILIADSSSVRRVATITNNTLMTLDAAPSSPASSSAFSKRYLVGDIVDLSLKGVDNGTDRTVTISSSTSAAFDLKETYTGTVSASIITNLRKTTAQEIKKILRTNRLVKIRISTNPATTVGPWNLGLSDVIRINWVRKKGSAFASTSEGTLVTENFALDDGQRDNFYDHAKLRPLVTGAVASGDYLLVSLDHFEHDTTQGAGYYSVDSYPVDDVNGAANTNAITTQQIPLFRSTITGEVFNLRDCIDTRSAKTNTATTTTVIGSATENPATTNSFIVPTGGLHTATPNSDFIIDYSYYLPRKDLIIVDKNGLIQQIKGIPSLNPAVPNNLEESMVLSIVNIAPYPSLPSSIAVAANRPSYANKVQNIAIKRYTMKDIGTLEQRISNLEYYVTLSMLEKDTFDTKIVDEDGLDRFKNGILVDPFNDHGVGDLSNPDYNIAVDRTASEIRPIFVMDDIAMKYVSNSGLTLSGKNLTRPYTTSTYLSQPNATSTRNAAGLFYNYVGDIVLTPNSDYWVDTTTIPDLQITDTTNLDNWQQLSDAWGTDWGAWQTVITGSVTTAGRTTTSTSTSRIGSSTTTSTTTTTSGGGTTTTATSTRSGTELLVSSGGTQTQNYGDRVVDVSVIPFIRQQTVKYFGSGFKPSTKLYAFFDGENITSYTKKTDSNYLNPSSTLMTDSNGLIYGTFVIPNNNSLRFRTGQRNFRLTDSSTNETDQGLVTTSGQAAFNASGLNQTKQNTIVSTEIPDISINTLTQTATVTTFSPTPTTSSTQTRVINGTSGGGGGGSEAGGSSGRGTGSPNDPIAQTFLVDSGLSPGLFFTGVNLYFASKHATYGAIVELRELNSAQYITNKVVPGSKVRIPSASINVSATAATATTVTFDGPIFLMNNTSYALIVKPEANNDQTTLWVAKLGRTDVVTGEKISKQPFAGVLYASSNDGVYEPIQDEDFKLDLFIAQFTSGSGYADFVNVPTDFLSLSSTSGEWDEVSETIYGETRMVVSGVTGGTIANTDIIVGTTSGGRGTVVSGTSPNFRLKDVFTDFTPVETFSVRYANNTAKGVTGTISSTVVPLGTLLKYNSSTANTFLMDVVRTNSTAFTVGENIRGETSNNSAIIGSFQAKKFNLVNPQSAEVILLNTYIDWDIRTTSNTNSLSALTRIPVGSDYTVSEEKIISSASVASDTLRLRSTLTTFDTNVSPVVNTSRVHNIFVHNIINNDSTGEDSNTGGNALNKYITRKVTLAEGQDAEDLKVYVTGYRPPSTDILVYAKLLNASDSDTFDDIEWVPLTMTSKNLYSDTEDRLDFKELEYSIDDANLTGLNGEYQYINSKNVQFTGYKYLSIKIVLLSSDSVVVPRCRDMRAICLQK
jgi:hypothetical protein